MTMEGEEVTTEGPLGFDAIFISVMDSRCMVGAATHFRQWKIPFRSAERDSSHPLIWAGGQGLHNPLPMAPSADLIVIGDGEDPVPALLREWDRTRGDRKAFLSAAAAVPGVFVPSLHDRRSVVIEQSVATDIGVTLRNDVTVNRDGTRRIEIARGCQYKCTFCSLGWRTPVRENSVADVVALIRLGGKKFHLQAGDAESHSGIGEIRAALAENGGRDQGWTGRLDTLLDNPDSDGIPGHKKYAFGVEGISHRLRGAVGKGYLTDERLVSDTMTFFDRVDDNSVGRGAWHLIAGLPTERPEEVLGFIRMIADMNERCHGKRARNLTLHWQPFQPLPGTPMQWCPAGGGARRLSGMIRGIEKLPWVRVRQLVGRTDEMAKVCTILSRADERGADLLEAMADGKVTVERAEAITGRGCGQIDPDSPLPWDFIHQHYGRDVLRRAYDVMMRRLAETEPSPAALTL